MAFESEVPGGLKERNCKLRVDRISSLPDEILIIILNLLPTKYAFITSTLSRRWSHLFKEVNNVDFKDSLLCNCEDCWVAFGAFMSNMMYCIKLSNLKRVRMRYPRYHGRCFAGKVESWLLAILSHGIKEIDLCFDPCIKLPQAIFNCNTLCVLKLATCYMLDLPKTVCLPCLKILHLNRVILKEASVNKIIAGCPSLHDFCMESFCVRGSAQLSISVPSLTNLKLDNSQIFVNYQPRALVAIVAPLLQYFHYGDHLAKSYSIMTSSYLVEAHLDISRIKDFEDVSAISHSAHSLIQGVSSVKRLFLSGHCMEALTYVKDELPILRNLKKLKLGCSTILHVALPRLLESAPYLEELIFTEGLFPINFTEQDIFRRDHWGRLKDVPSCLKTQIKVIEIEHLLGLSEELKIVEFFLSNSQSLAHVIIHKWVGTSNGVQVRDVRKQLERMASRSKKSVHFCDKLL